jgi:uncharacterized protein (DUF58 family)
MRSALRALTPRGRALAAAGAAVACFALLAHERDLMRVALFVLALPLLAALFVVRTRFRLSCVRRLEPPRVMAGHSARITLQVRNLSRVPTGLLLVEDQLPYELGGRPRFAIDRLEPDGVGQMSYEVTSDARGRYRIGPLVLRITDPFGLCELSRSFASTEVLTVTPSVVRLPAARLRGDWAGSGDSSAHWVATSGEDDVATREYRQGDDLRRVHWRSTAHVGELMVRREEQPWHSGAALLLDTRRVAHAGDGLASSLEWAVSAVASIGVQLHRQGYRLRLATDGGDVLAADLQGAPFNDALLDRLAVTTASRQVSLDAGMRALRRGPREGLFVAVLGHLDANDVDLMLRLRQGTMQAVAVLLDTGHWAGVDERWSAERFEHNIRMFNAAGWHVLPARRGSRLADLWSRLEAAGEPALAAAGPARFRASGPDGFAERAG